MRGTLPVLKKAPVIDGVISPGEWNAAVSLYGLQNWNTLFLHGRQGSCYFAVDSKYFYFASRTELPPKEIGLLSRVKKTRRHGVSG